jgi:predicted HicB family RNase H-like nuclease
MKETTTLLNAWIPVDVHARAKMYALTSKKTLRQVVIDALERYLARAEKKANGGGGK